MYTPPWQKRLMLRYHMAPYLLLFGKQPFVGIAVVEIVGYYVVY